MAEQSKSRAAGKAKRGTVSVTRTSEREIFGARALAAELMVPDQLQARQDRISPRRRRAGPEIEAYQEEAEAADTPAADIGDIGGAGVKGSD